MVCLWGERQNMQQTQKNQILTCSLSKYPLHKFSDATGIHGRLNFLLSQHDCDTDSI